MRVGNGTGGNTERVRRRRVVALVAALAALALLSGCTQDPEPGAQALPSRIELADVRLVRADDCDVLVEVAEERDAALRRQRERAEELIDVSGAMEDSGAGVDGAMPSSAEGAASAGDAPATTVVPTPSDDAVRSPANMDPANRDAAQSRASAPADETTGGTVIAGTNNQEQGVDEGDLVKTDGRRLVTLSSDGVLRVVVLDDEPAIDAELPILPVSSSFGGQQGELLLRGDELVAVAGLWDSGNPVTHIVRVDLSDAAAPRVVEQVRVAGGPVATRMVDGRIRIVLRPQLGGPIVEPMPTPVEPPTETTVPATSVPDMTVPATTVPDTSASTTTTTEPGATSTTTSAPEADGVSAEAARLLPRRLTAAGTTEPLGGCDDVVMPPATAIAAATIPGGTSPGFAGDSSVSSAMTVDGSYPASSAVTVLTVGDTLGDLSPITVEGGAETVYASTDALYTTATAYGADGPVTAVHRFDLAADGPAAYTGSGLVPGALLNQYSLSDRDGALRVVTTATTTTDAVPDDMIGNGRVEDDSIGAVRPRSFDRRMTTAGRIAVLRPDDDGTLREVGHLDDLGVDEQVKSVRFIEDRAYVVTFRQTDPLFAVDLSDDTAPKLLGELKLPGFSEYLHPLGDGRLLGIGSEADEDTGGVTGFKATLFDVADPTQPKELDSFVEANATSAVGYDPHSFTWDPVRRQAIVPVATSGSWDCPPNAECVMPVEPMPTPMPTEDMPTEDLPADDAPSTTLACPPDACDRVAPSVMPWTGVYVLGVEGDSIVVRGKVVHELAPSYFPQILRSVVVEDDLWTVSDAAVGRTDADRPTGVTLLPF